MNDSNETINSLIENTIGWAEDKIGKLNYAGWCL